jgi:hypothetical protein
MNRTDHFMMKLAITIYCQYLIAISAPLAGPATRG